MVLEEACLEALLASYQEASLEACQGLQAALEESFPESYQVEDLAWQEEVLASFQVVDQGHQEEEALRVDEEGKRRRVEQGVA